MRTATGSAEARSPRFATAGSPGTRWVRTNAITLTARQRNTNETRRRPMKKRRGCWERRLASAAPSDLGADRGEVEVPDGAVNDICEVFRPYHGLPGLNEWQHRALLVEQSLQLLKERATRRIVGC